MSATKITKEGSLEAPTRHPINWQDEDFWNQQSLELELERVFDICHGCRRCVSLCNSFPTLFDLIDESETMEVDGVDKADYSKVVEQCYLCDMCYMSKCPYVPPHEWNLDFPHLMLRAKANQFKQQGTSVRNKLLSDTNNVPKLASLPVLDKTVNALTGNTTFRRVLEKFGGVHQDAVIPKYHSNSMRKRLAKEKNVIQAQPMAGTTGKVALYATCYGNYNSPDIGVDCFKVFQHNKIHIELVAKEKCCGMPKLELGDIESVKKAKEANIPILAKLVDEGYDLTALIPSCVLMYKQELPLLFPDDPDVKKVQQAFYDPFEYLALRHKEGGFNTEFSQSLGQVSYQVPCHLRVQNIGNKAKDLLSMIPDTDIHTEERCSGHDGTYAVKVESFKHAVKIAKPVVRKVDQRQPDYLISDCPMAANHIAGLASSIKQPDHPITLMRIAYNL